MNKFIENLKLLNTLNPNQNPLVLGFSQKISEFNKKIREKEEIIRKNKDEFRIFFVKRKKAKNYSINLWEKKKYG